MESVQKSLFGFAARGSILLSSRVWFNFGNNTPFQTTYSFVVCIAGLLLDVSPQKVRLVPLIVNDSEWCYKKCMMIKLASKLFVTSRLMYSLMYKDWYTIPGEEAQYWKGKNRCLLESSSKKKKRATFLVSRPSSLLSLFSQLSKVSPRFPILFSMSLFLDWPDAFCWCQTVTLSSCSFCSMKGKTRHESLPLFSSQPLTSWSLMDVSQERIKGSELTKEKKNHYYMTEKLRCKKHNKGNLRLGDHGWGNGCILRWIVFGRWFPWCSASWHRRMVWGQSPENYDSTLTFIASFFSSFYSKTRRLWFPWLWWCLCNINKNITFKQECLIFSWISQRH